MTNRNKKLLDESQEKQFERKKSIFCEIIFLESVTSLSIIGVSLLLFLFSIINVSVVYSVILAIFSTLVTLSFEITEWIKYLIEKKSKKESHLFSQILYHNTLALMISIIILMTIIFGLEFAIKINPNLSGNIMAPLPNIITTGALMLYFISYSVRCLVKECRDFRKKYKKYYKKAPNR